MQQSRLFFDIVTADKELVCYTGEEIVCINPKASWLQLLGGDIIIHVHEIIPTPQTTSYVSCIPKWSEGKVSRLHNSHMILDSEGFLVGEEYRIRVQDLQIANIVNKEMVDLSTFLIQNNIFITTQNELLGISCAENELLFIKNQKFTCNKEIIWTNSSEDIFCAKGTILRSTISSFYQESKLNLQLEEENEFENFLTLEETNLTSFTSMLEGLNTLPTTQNVGMSLGVSGFIILLFIIAIICTRLFWSEKYCCGPHPRSTNSPDDADVIIGQQVLSEDRKNSLTRRATEMVLNQLGRN